MFRNAFRVGTEFSICFMSAVMLLLLLKGLLTFMVTLLIKRSEAFSVEEDENKLNFICNSVFMKLHEILSLPLFQIHDLLFRMLRIHTFVET